MMKIPCYLLCLELMLFASVSRADSPVQIDGTSHMSNISRAMIQAAQDSNFLLNVSDSESGTGGGFKRFATGSLDVNKAARPIKDREKQACDQNGIVFVEILVAHSTDQSESLRFFVNAKSLGRENLVSFLGYCLSDEAQEVIKSQGTPLTAAELESARKVLRQAIADVE